MASNLIVPSPAWLDYVDSKEWYDSKLQGLGTDFIKEVTATIRYVASNPFPFQRRRETIRWARLKRFPYVVVYAANRSGNVIIYAIFHTSQNPRKLRARTT